MREVSVAIWNCSLCQPEHPEHVLNQLLALGAGSTSLAAAGGLLGAAQGLGSLSEGFVRGIEQRRVLLGALPPSAVRCPPPSRRHDGGRTRWVPVSDVDLCSLIEAAGPAWQARGRCRSGPGHDPLFPGRREGHEEAQAFCTGCEVRSDCLEYDLDNGIDHGVGAGPQRLSASASGVPARWH